jgi:CHASE2 domain-containing sensor protein
MSFQDQLKAMLLELRHKGLRYWCVVVVLILIGMYVGNRLHQLNALVKVRYSIYQFLHQLAPYQPHPKRTVLVLIGDEEYWTGDLARRVPIKRTYLAQLLEILDKADPEVIALDFALRSPVPDGSLIEHPDYQDETAMLLNTIKSISRTRTIVLPATVMFDNQHNYILESAIYNGFDFGNRGVVVGYISLPYDIRQIPLSLDVSNNGTVKSINSFAGAIVGAVDKAALLQTERKDSLPYGSYMKAESFKQIGARDVFKLKDDTKALHDFFAHKIIIIGGAWHALALGRGAQIDAYLTPVGVIGGAFIHANYVEALLDSRLYKPLTDTVIVSIELIFTCIVAVIFALNLRPRSQMGVSILLCIILGIVSYFFLQNLGIFFDFFIPTVLLGSHVVVEKVREWRAAAHHINP